MLSLVVNWLLFVNACGPIQITPLDSLLVVARPLDGANNISVQVAPMLYFSDELEPKSVTQDSVYLMVNHLIEWKWEPAPADFDDATGAYVHVCKGPWSWVSGSAYISGTNQRQLIFLPENDLLKERCYQMICTTGLRGVHTGHLQASFPLDYESNTFSRAPGVIQSFRTGLPVKPQNPL